MILPWAGSPGSAHSTTTSFSVKSTIPTSGNRSTSMGCTRGSRTISIHHLTQSRFGDDLAQQGTRRRWNRRPTVLMLLCPDSWRSIKRQPSSTAWSMLAISQPQRVSASWGRSTSVASSEPAPESCARSKMWSQSVSAKTRRLLAWRSTAPDARISTFPRRSLRMWMGHFSALPSRIFCSW